MDSNMYKVLLFFMMLSSVFSQVIDPIPQRSDCDKAKAKLGKKIFSGTILSKNMRISCSSCHSFRHGGADTKVFSIGVDGKPGHMNAPTIYNASFNFKQFWNARAADLKEQANMVIHNPLELSMNKKELEKRFNSSEVYKKAFFKVYGVTNIRYENIVDAIAEFEKALITPNSKFDKYLRHEVELSDEEKDGYVLFKQYGCISCHNGINLGGNSIQKFGAVRTYPWKDNIDDRFKVTKKEFDKNRFKVPTLRNVYLTAPYFHDGSAPDLFTAVNQMAYLNLGITLNDEENKKIVAFLKTLTGDIPAILEDDEN